MEKSVEEDEVTFVEDEYAPLGSLIQSENSESSDQDTPNVYEHGVEVNRTQVLEIGNLSSESSSIPCMSFNAEMFLRTMSICHTVFVEKDLEYSQKSIKKKSSFVKFVASSVLHPFKKSMEHKI